jgi:hypothetical protein
MKMKGEAEPNGVIFVTQTMLDKSIIDANKTVQEFAKYHLLIEYDMFEAGDSWVFPMLLKQDDMEYVLNVKFYKTKGRGDKRVSIEKLGRFAQARDLVTLWVDDDMNGRIDIEHDAFG